MAEKESPRCDHCGGPATHQGWAFPAGGSFPVTGCLPCLQVLAKDMAVEVAPFIPPATTTRCCKSHHFEGCADGAPGCCPRCPINPSGVKEETDA
jgi:hypothetical protein